MLKIIDELNCQQFDYINDHFRINTTKFIPEKYIPRTLFDIRIKGTPYDEYALEIFHTTLNNWIIGCIETKIYVITAVEYLRDQGLNSSEIIRKIKGNGWLKSEARLKDLLSFYLKDIFLHRVGEGAKQAIFNSTELSKKEFTELYFNQLQTYGTNIIRLILNPHHNSLSATQKKDILRAIFYIKKTARSLFRLSKAVAYRKMIMEKPSGCVPKKRKMRKKVGVINFDEPIRDKIHIKYEEEYVSKNEYGIAKKLFPDDYMSDAEMLAGKLSEKDKDYIFEDMAHVQVDDWVAMKDDTEKEYERIKGKKPYHTRKYHVKPMNDNMHKLASEYEKKTLDEINKMLNEKAINEDIAKHDLLYEENKKTYMYLHRKEHEEMRDFLDTPPADSYNDMLQKNEGNENDDDDLSDDMKELRAFNEKAKKDYKDSQRKNNG